MTIVHFQSTIAAGIRILFDLNAGQSAPGPSQGRGYALGQPIGTFGTLSPTAWKQVSIVELYTLDPGGDDRLNLSLNDQTLPDGYLATITVEGFPLLKVSDASFINRAAGNTTWGWNGFGALNNGQQYDVLITG